MDALQQHGGNPLLPPASSTEATIESTLGTLSSSQDNDVLVKLSFDKGSRDQVFDQTSELGNISDADKNVQVNTSEYYPS